MPLVSNREPLVGDSLEFWAHRLSEEPGDPTIFSELKRAFESASDAGLDRFLTDVTLCTAVAAALVSLAGEVVWSGPQHDLGIRVFPCSAGTPWEVILRVGPDGIALLAEAGPAEVTVSLDVRAVADLVAGRIDGALLYLADRLQVDGDGALLLELGMPGLIDPQALDPEAVSAAIKDVRTDHLDAVMAGAFRHLVLDEVFRRLPEFLNTEKAARVRLAIGFEIEGTPVDRYVVDIVDGACVVAVDPTGERAVAVTLVLSGAEFLRLVLGHLNPVRAVLGGQVRVRGEVLKALAFNSLMSIPGR